jgi:hypothetical protein
MIKLGRLDIQRALHLAEKGLKQYVAIQSLLNKLDVSKNVDFQKRFTAFYRVRRNETWRTQYFSLLEVAKNEKFDFGEALKRIRQLTDRVEASFASKLVATIDTRLPVIDIFVLQNVGIKLPSPGAKDREETIIRRHAELRRLLDDYLETPDGKYLVSEFKRIYPWAQISEHKMLDLVLWQTRKLKDL